MTKYFYYICIIETCLGCVSFTFSPNKNTSKNCDVLTKIDSGWVCGRIRTAEEDVKYASFRGIPYAQQPEGELRFKELQPLDAWDDVLVTTEEGPKCPQYDDLYSRMARPSGMSESCIFANVHVPLKASEIQCTKSTQENTGLPILVFVPGGGFQAGSGNSDIYGPEYLISKAVIVITFNYRLNVFGFLSLNSAKIPGNNGLRDTITLLKWVQRNARAFGGDPDNVTLAGHSCGSVIAHLVSLSETSKGLFHRLILMSGLANGGFYTTSPVYAKSVAEMFLEYVGINSTDADDIHDQLVQMSLDTIMAANRIVQFKTRLISFVPVVESNEHYGVTRILDDYPVSLIKQGRGRDLPMIVGSTLDECEFFKRKLTYIDILALIEERPVLMLPPHISHFLTTNKALNMSRIVKDRYFKEDETIDNYIKCCTNTFFTYPAFKAVQWRASLGGAPVYMYQYSYDSDFNIIKYSLMLNYARGGAHTEDLTFLFRTNSMMQADEKSFPPINRDDLMKLWMVTSVVNFMRCSHPVCNNRSEWPAVDAELINYQRVHEPLFISNVNMTEEQRDMFEFHQNLFTMARNNDGT